MPSPDCKPVMPVSHGPDCFIDRISVSNVKGEDTANASVKNEVESDDGTSYDDEGEETLLQTAAEIESLLRQAKSNDKILSSLDRLAHLPMIVELVKKISEQTDLLILLWAWKDHDAPGVRDSVVALRRHWKNLTYYRILHGIHPVVAILWPTMSLTSFLNVWQSYQQKPKHVLN